MVSVKSNYLSLNTAATRTDPRLLANRRNSGDQSAVNMKDKTKENEYLKRIHDLEGAIADWVCAQKLWEKEKQQLQTEKSALVCQYEELKADSEKRNLELPDQIDEIKLALSSNANEEQRVRKKSKKCSSIDEFVKSSQVTKSDRCIDIDMEVTPTEPKSEKPPPIFVYGVTNCTEFAQFFSSNEVDECTQNETNRELILYTKTVDQYR